jgi:ubiquitin-protein ligase
MRQSPRIRRLKNDHKAMEKLRSESTILDFDASGAPADKYVVRFYGQGLWRPNGAKSVMVRELHEVRIVLGASYPRMMPELNWVSPVFHPNISASGIVCLGGYGTHWVPSLSLDELCEMLWDMIRYQNFDVESPYNREAALWAKTQTTYMLPLDRRSLRDRVARDAEADRRAVPTPSPANAPELADTPQQWEVVIIEDASEEVIDAELVDSEDLDGDIVFLD